MSHEATNNDPAEDKKVEVKETVKQPAEKTTVTETVTEPASSSE